MTMRIFDIIGMSFKNLWRRKVRTLLTVLGVVIGSCAIIVMISLGLGMNNAIRYYLTQFGDLNVITVYGDMWVYDEESGQSKEPLKLNDEAVESIKQISNIDGVFPKMNVNGVSLCAGKGGRYRMPWSEIYAVDPQYMEKFGFTVLEGDIPEDYNDNLIIFGSQSAYNFYDSKKRTNNMVYPMEKPDGTVTPPYFDPLTEKLVIYANDESKYNESDMGGYYSSAGKSSEYKVQCVAILDGENSGGNYEAWSGVFISTELAEKLYKDYNKINKVKDPQEQTYSQVKIWVNDINNVAEVQEQIEAMGYYCDSMESARKSMQGQLGSVQALLGGLAAISLFVAAIGITNTMIMSIYERTREIGVMKVMGCRLGNIREMFLIEAACIGFVGGVAGTALSYIISFFFNKFGMSMLGLDYMYMLDDGTTLPVSLIPVWLVLLALLFSTLVGIVSGFYPANRAVKISALEAIKNE